MTPSIRPGSTLGILGGGQLGRMTALAAARLGLRCHVLAPEAAGPAAEVAAAFTQASFEDAAALDRFAQAVDVVTLEFENVAVAALDRLARQRPVRPSAAVLRVTQDRLLEKQCIQACGLPVAPNWPVDGVAELQRALTALDGPGLLKTRRLGYDGHGQLAADPGSDAAALWRALGGVPAILERRIDLAMELSSITARGVDGTIRSFPLTQNLHQAGILRQSRVPAAVPAAVGAQAILMGEALAEALDVQGLLTTEFFLGTDGRLLVNELAPRPHNSGHWTVDACVTSQFEQLVRAVCGWPLGEVGRLAPATMDNLLGDDVDDWPRLLAEPGARLHLYGKPVARPGRKMGHVTRLGPPA